MIKHAPLALAFIAAIGGCGPFDSAPRFAPGSAQDDTTHASRLGRD